MKGEGDCPDGEAEAIAKRLGYLPLAILAAGTFIREEREWNEVFTLDEYQVKFDNISEAMNISATSETDYPHSMWSALFLAVRSNVEGHSNADIFKDFCALVGFMDQEEISLDLVKGYLKMKGHSNKSISKSKLKDFPLVEYLVKKRAFRVHQVTRNAFREELIERSTRHSARRDLLLENFRNISHFVVTRNDLISTFAPLSFFGYVLAHHDYSWKDIILPEGNLDVVSSILKLCGFIHRCSKLEQFVARLSATNNPYIRFLGCRLDHDSFQLFDQTDLSKEYAVRGR